MADSPIEMAVNLTEAERKAAAQRYPGPSDFVHLHNHTLFSPLDGIATPAEYFSACAELGHPAFAITDHGSIANVPDAYWAAEKNKVKFLPGCFLPDQPILTSAGVIPIEDVKPGMLAFTHRGRWRKILNLQIRDYDGDLAVVESWGSSKQVATANHKFLIKSDREKRLEYKTEWIKIGDVQRRYYRSQPRSATPSNKSRWGNYLCVPKPIDQDISHIDILEILNENESNQYYIDEGLIKREYVKSGFRTVKSYDSNIRIELNDETLWIIGAFLAEGSFRKVNQKVTSLTFSFGGSEMNYAKRVEKYFNNLGINCYINDRRPNRNLIEIEVCSTTISRAFHTLFGEGASNKKLPFNWINLPPSKLEPLLTGLFDGDGKWKDDQSTIKLTSKTLIWQIRLMLAKLGRLSAITRIKPGRDDQKESFSVRWRNKGKTYSDQDLEYHYSPVKKTQSKPYKGIVYNIEVEEDHSYFTGVAVKNCEIYFSQDFLEFKTLREEDPDFKIRALRPDYSKDVFHFRDLEMEERYSSFRRFRHLSVMAKDMLGYRNLIQMTTEAWEIGFYYKPRVWFEQIEKYHEGLIILSGCLNGPVCHNLRKAAFWAEIAKGKTTHIERSINKKKKSIKLSISKEDAAKRQKMYFGKTVEWINKFRSLMGDRFYLELQMPGDDIPFGKEAFRQIVWLSKKLGVKAVISNDCLTSNFKVLTKTRGYVNINQLRIDEEVLTHKGNYKRIVAIGSRGPKPNENFYSWFESDYIATGNHKLFICRDEQIMQMPLDKIKNDDCLVVRRIDLPKNGVDKIKLSDFMKDDRCTVKNGMVYPRGYAKNPVPDEIELCDDFLWLIGYYIAEGYSDKYRLSFAHHKTEKSYINRVKSYFSKFGFSPNYDEKCTGSENGARTRICSSAFTLFFKNACGTRAYNKKLPSFWNRLSQDQLKILLRGYLDGDGSYTKKANRPGLFNVSYSTVSLELSLGLLKAFSSLGIAPTLNYRKPRIIKIKNREGKLIETKCRSAYTGNIKKYGCYVLGLIDNHKRSSPYKEIDGFILIKNCFRKTDKIPERVYDIEVEDDHSFNIGFESTNCHYLSRPDFKVQKCMMAVDQGLTIDDPNLFHVNSDEQFFKSRAQLRKTFIENGYNKFASLEDFEEYCDNTVELSERCTGFQPDLGPKLPYIKDAETKLTKLVIQSLKDRGLYGDQTKYIVDGREVTYKEQALIELKRYIEKGFASYFLIIRDLLEHSKSKGWDVGPGRGSAGGSLVCYLIGIHQIDPLKWGLSSVRFMGDSRGGKLLNIKME